MEKPNSAIALTDAAHPANTHLPSPYKKRGEWIIWIQTQHHFENVHPSQQAQASSAHGAETLMGYCRSLIFLHRFRWPWNHQGGQSRQRVLLSSPHPGATSHQGLHGHGPAQHLPLCLPGNGCKNLSLDSACYRGKLHEKIQASKEVEMMTTSVPAIHLGTEILVLLWADLNSS